MLSSPPNLGKKKKNENTLHFDELRRQNKKNPKIFSHAVAPRDALKAPCRATAWYPEGTTQSHCRVPLEYHAVALRGGIFFPFKYKFKQN